MNSHRPRKRFGQHFLVRDDIASDIVAAIEPREGDTLVEIGPGKGALTFSLARSGCRLHAIEFDRDLFAQLSERFSGNTEVTLHQRDALEFDFASLGEKLRVVGNLPYNISTPLLFHLVDAKQVIADMHFMLQKEVVDRICASPGSKNYGRLTIMLGCYLESLPLFEVPPEAFSPPPRVQSAVIRLRPFERNVHQIQNHDVLSHVVTQAFMQRRKTIRNALKATVATQLIESCGIDPGKRPEEVAIADWVALSNSISS